MKERRGQSWGENPQEQQSYGAARWGWARRKHRRCFAAFSHVVAGHRFRKAVSEPAPASTNQGPAVLGGGVGGGGDWRPSRLTPGGCQPPGAHGMDGEAQTSVGHPCVNRERSVN